MNVSFGATVSGASDPDHAPSRDSFTILHPLNFSGLAENSIVKFCARVGLRSISLVITNCPQVSVVTVT